MAIISGNDDGHFALSDDGSVDPHLLWARVACAPSGGSEWRVVGDVSLQSGFLSRENLSCQSCGRDA